MQIIELYRNESRWCQGASARDARGFVSDIHGTNSVCWCFGGAIQRCYPTSSVEVRQRIKDHLGIENLVHWNDAPGRTFEDVLAVVKELGL